MRRTLLIGAPLLSAILLAGCADLPARVRRHTYPPNFKYIGRAELRSTMWRLAADVDQLDDVMREPGPIDEARRAQIAQLLAAMDDAARDLVTNGRPTNHPLIADNLDGFRRAVATARTSAASERPNYYLIGSVTGACLSCHGPDR
jgi:outer membrane murein-binding lipoprotein Lpp